MLDVPTYNPKTKETLLVSEQVYNIDDFPYSKYRQAKRIYNHKNQTSYYNISASYDIETTTIDGIKDDKGKYVTPPYGFMYQWQVCIKDTVCFGRTWEEWVTFMKRLRVGLQLSEKKKLIIYVHNLSYEFQFMKDFVTIHSLFAKDARKVMKMNTLCYEFRCSYFLSNMNLIKFCENSQLCKHYKMVDNYDYRKLRTPNTELTDEELAYCYNDVRGLCECIDTLLLEDDINTIPLTNTGYVRRDFRKEMKANKKNRANFEKTQLNSEEYKMLRRAFRGGNTHASRFHANKIHEKVYSYDIQSSYPAAMLINEYPMGKFMRVTLDTQEKIDKYCNENCVVMDIEFFNIKVKENITMPYIDIAHCVKQNKIVNDNGRVLEAEYITLTITNIDLDIIRRTYDFDGLNVTNAIYARKGKLPQEFRETVMKFYKLKTELKGVEGKEYEYMKSKNKVNSSYGMTVTAIDHSEIMYTNHEWTEIKPELDEALEQYYKSRNNFLSYQWGVFVTANARKNLQDLLDLVGLDAVYTDTDSIKFINIENNKHFEEANKRLTKLAYENDIPAYAVDRKGVKHPLGIWDCETKDDDIYTQFKTLGAKKYAYYQNGKFHTTVSGMHKKKGAKAVGNIENFIIGKTFADVGRTTSWYNEEEVHNISVQGEIFTTGSNIGIVDTTYTLGITDEYFEILENYVVNLVECYN
jgi:DNA polymerase type B, organellar and viral.